jgi:hypothetical protein
MTSEERRFRKRVVKNSSPTVEELMQRSSRAHSGAAEAIHLLEIVTAESKAIREKINGIHHRGALTFCDLLKKI